MIKNILIDLDGTLIDPKVGITTSARYGLAKVGHPIADSENIDWIIGPPLKASLAKILKVDVHADLAEQALLGYRERFSVTGLFENHVFDDTSLLIREQGVTSKGIQIGNNVWIGAKATFLDGAIVGNNSVVAAGAVVNGIFPDNVVLGGVPAKIIKTIA